VESEFTGSRLLLRWLEVRQRGLGPSWWRVRYELRKRLGLLARPAAVDLSDPAAALALLADAPDSLDALLEHFRTAPAGHSIPFEQAPDDYRAALRPQQIEATIAAADEAAERRYHLLGQTFDFSGGEIDWHLDPQSGRDWPREPWDRIDIRSPRRLGDVKYTWELNRCQHWPTLGRAYWLTGDEKYAEEWGRQFDSWIEQNPPEIGVNWLSNLEHAIRLISWWTAARFFMHSAAMTPERLGRLLLLCQAKAEHIIADLDYSLVNMGNNHVIGDATGLAFIALAVPEFREAARWRQIGLDILWRELPRQVYADGASFECSAGYHRFVMQFAMLTLVMCEAGGVDVPEVVRRRVEKMAEFLAGGIRPDGSLPQFGDFDSGLAYRLGDYETNDYRPLLATAAAKFGRADLLAAAGSCSDEAIWLLGAKAANAHGQDALAAKSDVCTNVSFPIGGYCFGRWGCTRVFVGNGRFLAHTHADLLELVLWHDRPVLVDSGTWAYNGPWRWRTWFRSTAAHNTLTIDGRGQAFAHRVFRWIYPARGREHALPETCGPFVFDGEHDGYRRIGLTHRRVVISIDERHWLVLDVVDGRTDRPHDLTLHWHLAPELEAEIADKDVTAITDGNGRTIGCLAWATTDGSPQARLFRGDEETPAGWYSRGYGQREPATELRVSTNAPAPWAAATLISLGEADSRVTSVVREGSMLRASLQLGTSAATGDSAAGLVEIRYDLAAARRLTGTGEIGNMTGADATVTPLGAIAAGRAASEARGNE
jgi:uncharacterized heparinase superfamily protein